MLSTERDNKKLAPEIEQKPETIWKKMVYVIII